MPEALPAAQPVYVLRGHASQLHALAFGPDNSRLLSGDAHGWLVSWSLASKRPVAVWKAHAGAVLGLAFFDHWHAVSHGRDNKVRVWKLGVAYESVASRSLPLEQPDGERALPDTLHELTVNTLNFCSFAWCYEQVAGSVSLLPGHGEGALQATLLAVPNTLDSDAIDIFQLPSERRVSSIPAVAGTKTGMAMALHISAQNMIRVIAGYESGHAAVFCQPAGQSTWQQLYLTQAHTQPVLSLAVSPSSEYFLTSSADAILAKHPLFADATAWAELDRPLKTVQTRHAGQQGLHLRSDGKIFATAGWDGRVRVYSASTMRELAVLKWHSLGCYTTAFATIYPLDAITLLPLPLDEEHEMQTREFAVESTSRQVSTFDTDLGQTPGRELASSQQGSALDPASDQDTITESSTSQQTTISDTVLEQTSHQEIGLPVPADVRSFTSALTLAERRDFKAQTTHWLAVGSKDCRISLWSIY